MLLDTRRERLKKLGLSGREADVVIEVACGLTNKQVAARLCISFYTVQSHLKSVYRKLNVTRRTALLRRLVDLQT